MSLGTGTHHRTRLVECIVDGCDHLGRSAGMCYMHYARKRRTGSVGSPTGHNEPVEVRFWSKVAKGGLDECWPWQGSMHPQGYGSFGYSSRRTMHAHRAAYILTHGKAPGAGLVVDHRCRNRACCNPAHLRAVTQKQNGENLGTDRPANRTSGLRGVSQRANGKWRARVTHNRRTYSAGNFATAEEATAAATALRLRLFTCNDEDRRSA